MTDADINFYFDPLCPFACGVPEVCRSCELQR